MVVLVCGNSKDGKKKGKNKSGENEGDFEKIFSHNTKGGLFRPDNVKRKESNNAEADLFSKLEFLDDSYKNQEGKFHFKICYPDIENIEKCNEWKQTSNPVKHGKITGFEAVGNLSFTQNGVGEPWGGLGKSDKESHTLIDDTGSDSKWNMAVGAFKHEDKDKKTIPGPKGEKKIKQVELYVKKGMFLFSHLLTIPLIVLRLYKRLDSVYLFLSL